MPRSYLVSLLLSVVAVVTARLLLAVRVSRLRASRASRPAALLVLLGWLGLTFHCGAMFFRSAVDRIPGVGPLVDAVNAMGGPSVTAYVLPAALLVVGLRRARPWLVSSVVVALAAVGVTMYSGGSLDTHLAAIFLAVVLMALTTADAPFRRHRPDPR